MKKKWVAGIILVLMGTSLISANAQEAKTPLLPSRGTWLYVGGEGPGNYTMIQTAIDAANSGDTIYVYQGIYPEHVVISKNISLLGEDKNTTIIDGQDFMYVVSVMSQGTNLDTVVVNGFTIRNATEGLVISDNFVKNEVRNITISDNIFTDCLAGIATYGGTNCEISQNSIKDNLGVGIEIHYGFSNHYTLNSIKNNPKGISIWYVSSKSLFEKNTIEGNSVGIVLKLDSRTTIKNNNFINNGVDTDILDSNFVIIPVQGFPWFYTKWVGNYWDAWVKKTPKPLATRYVLEFHLGSDYHEWDVNLGPFSFIEFDWSPRSTPFDI